MIPEAEAAFLKVTELSPKFAAAFYQLGVCYQRQGQPEKALEHYQKAIDLEPSNRRRQLQLGPRSSSGWGASTRPCPASNRPWP